MPAASAQQGKQAQDRIYVIALFLLVSPFYLNDFANIYIRDWRWWLFIDYTSVKLLPLLLLWWLIRSGHLSCPELGLVRQRPPAFLKVFCLVTLAGTLMDQNMYGLIGNLPGYPSLAPPVPEIASPVWNWIDLTLGLFFVGVFEELIFRGYMHTFLRCYTQSGIAIVFLSSVAFGLAHWSSGLHAVLVAAVIGAMLMITYMQTKSLPAIMLAHFAIDFIDFAGVIPRTMFKFV